MKKMMMVSALLILFAQVSGSQVKERSKSFFIPPLARPAVLSGTVQLIEPSGNGVLDAGEKGTIKISVTNSGGTAAKNVVAKVTSSVRIAGLQLQDSVTIAEIAPNDTAIGKVEIFALQDVQTQSVKLAVDLMADDGIKAETKSLTLATRAAAKPAMLAGTVEFTEPSGNKILDAGEKGTIKVTISNNGETVAKNVVAKLSGATAAVGLRVQDKITIGNIAPKTSAEGKFEVFALQDVQTQSLKLTVEVSGDNGITAEAKSLILTTVAAARPVALTATVEFTEPSGNKILDAGEKGAVKVAVSNVGGTVAKNVVAKLGSRASTAGLEFPKTISVGDIAPGRSASVQFDISAAAKVSSQTFDMSIEVTAENGIRAEPQPVSLATRAAAKPAMLAGTVEFTEPSGNKILDAGEKGEIKITVTNSGGTTAKNVVAKLSSAAPAVGVEFSKSVTIGDVQPGRMGNGRFDISASDYVATQSFTMTVEANADNGIKAEPKSVSISTRAVIKPAVLASTLQFTEPSGNGVLDAGETGAVAVSVSNSGGMPAKDVVLNVRTDVEVSGIVFPATVKVGDIASNGIASAQIPVQASGAVRSRTFTLNIETVDANGVTAEPKFITITAKEKVIAKDVTPPEIEILEPVNAATRGLRVVPTEAKFTTESSSITVRGTARDASGVAVVLVNNLEAHLAKGKNGIEFAGDALLVLGENEIEVRAMDPFRNESRLTIKVTRNPVAIVQQPTDDIKLLSGGKRWAVVVGVSKYKSERIPSLRYADKDAEGIYEILRKPMREGGMGVEPANIQLLLNENATSSKVRQALTDFLKQTIAEDQVFIFFAGHGAADPDRPKILYILTYDTDPENMASTSLKMEDFQSSLRDYVMAKNVFVWADACHSRGLGVSQTTRSAFAPPELINAYLEEIANARPGTWTFSASDIDQFSYEDPKWGGGHGVFTHFLIEGLKGAADLNNDHMIQVSELSQYVGQNVRRATSSKQSPISNANLDLSMPLNMVPSSTPRAK